MDISTRDNAFPSWTLQTLTLITRCLLVSAAGGSRSSRRVRRLSDEKRGERKVKEEMVEVKGEEVMEKETKSNLVITHLQTWAFLFIDILSYICFEISKLFEDQCCLLDKQQDLSQKCLAWKVVQKNFGSEKNFCQKNFCFGKKFGPKFLLVKLGQLQLRYY